jgi:hypothetical protein
MLVSLSRFDPPGCPADAASSAYPNRPAGPFANPRTASMAVKKPAKKKKAAKKFKGVRREK